MSNTHPDAFMPLWIADYLADTTHLTCEQHGAYFLLLMTYWRRGGHMPADNACLAAITKLSPQKWRTMRVVMEKFFREEGGQWKNKRADAEILKASKLKKDKAAAGKKGAEKRWSGHSSAIDQPSENAEKPIAENSPSPSPLQNKEDSEVRTSEPTGSPDPIIELVVPVKEPEPSKPFRPQLELVVAAPDVSRDLWGYALPLLMRAGKKEDQARRFLGKLCKTYEAADVLDAFETAEAKAAPDPGAYAAGVLTRKSKKVQFNGNGQYGSRRTIDDNPVGNFAALTARLRADREGREAFDA